MKSLSTDRPPMAAMPTDVRSALSIVVVDPCPADYLAALPEPQPGVWWQFITCARHALRTARVRAVDLWVVNTRLPDMSGLDLCRMLRDQERAAVYLVADRYSPDEERAARLCGAALFVCKPPIAQWLAAPANRRTARDASRLHLGRGAFY